MIIIASPDLDHLLADTAAVPSRLSALLARSDIRPIDQTAWAAELVVDHPVPAAPLTRLVDQPDDCDGLWLRADPVHLTPDMNAVWIRPGARLEPDHALVCEFQSLLAESGLSFDLPHPERGYLRLSSAPDCRFAAPDELEGQSLEHVLPSGPDQRFWRRMLNECQITAHQHARDNETNGPGGLWFWGPGSLPKSHALAPRVQRLFGRDPVWGGLARWLELNHASTPPDGRELPDGSLAEWLPDLGLDRSANLRALDAWLGPLWHRIRLGRLDSLEIASRRRAWRLTPAAAWRFWRRSSPSAA
jgi:hypothetical protein